MNTENYQKSISVNTTTEAAYKALTQDYSQWWTACEGAFKSPGDWIKFSFPPQISYWVFEAKKLVPQHTVELKCTDAHHIILDKPEASQTEWLGSLLRFNIQGLGDQTRIDFVHEGLMPELDCYEVCEAGWDHFFLNSLKTYLDTGVGKPHQSGT